MGQPVLFNMNTKLRTYKAFSLTDLLVYMGIVAVLVTMAFIGINIAQRSNRDEQRRLVAAQIRTAVDDYFRTTTSYPVENSSLNWSTSAVTIGTESVALNGAQSYSATATDATRTRYTYQKDRSGYIICVKLETGEWFRSGNGGDALTCPAN